MKNLIRKILRENDLDWIVSSQMPNVYRVTHSPSDGLEGYFTEESFKKYLDEANLDRYEDDESMYEHERDFDFELVNIRW